MINLYSPFGLLVWHPERIFWVAFFFLVVSGLYFILQRKYWPCLIATFAWTAYIFWEQHCKNTGANIRVDLLLLAPVLFVISAYGLVSGFRRRNSKPDDQNLKRQ